MNRLNKILLGVLVAQLAITALVLSSSKPTAPLGPTPLLPGLDAAKVTRVQIFPDKDAQAGVTSVPPELPLDLVKRGEGWVVASRFDYPAQSPAVTELVGKLGAVMHTGPVSTSKSRAGQLGVGDDNFERKVIVTVDGKDRVVLLGNPVGSRRNAIRVGGADAIYASSGLSPWGVSTSLRSWVSPTYAEAARDQVSKIVVAREGETVELVKDGAAWKAAVNGTAVTPTATEVLDTAAIDEVIGQVSQVELMDIADPKAPAGKAKATISVWVTPPSPPAAATPAAPAGAAAPTPGAAVPAAPTPGAAVPAAPSATPSVAVEPALVLTVVERDASAYVVSKPGAHAVVVDHVRLRTTVELARAKLLKKQEKSPPAPPSSPAASVPRLEPVSVPGLVTP